MSLPNVMQLLVRELNGVYERFVQGTGPAQLPDDLSGGYCQGACIAWLVLRRTGANLRTELKQQPEGWGHYMASIQREAKDIGLEVSKTQPTMAEHLVTTLENKGFHKAGTHLPRFPFDTIASYISNHETGGYYIMAVPGHAMAAHADQGIPHDPDKMLKDADNKYFRFFDPNAGEARFVTYVAFELFICRYFCHQEVSEAYGFRLRISEKKDSTKPKTYPMLDVNLMGADGMIKDENRSIFVYRLH